MLPAEMRTMNDLYVIEALLKHNYLPAQKGFGEELPPIFYSTSFSIEAAEALADISLRRNGYDSLKYGTTKPDQSTRDLLITHPLPYAHTVIQIASHWDDLLHITDNDCSHIKPSRSSDKRIISMNYDDQQLQQLERELDASFGKNFCVRADIKHCFSSMPTDLFSQVEYEIEPRYIDAGKPNYRNRWFYKLERSLALGNCNKMTGLPVGPASSNVVTEYLLCHVDRFLQSKGFTYNRYIDDYISYCKTHEEAEAFLYNLRESLSDFGLELNSSKTSISSFPQPLSADWLIDLQAALPSKKYDEYNYSVTEAIRYLDYALRLQQQFPSESVLKFAVKSILRHTSLDDKERVVHYVLNLSRHYPSLLPLLYNLDFLMEYISRPYLTHQLLADVVLESAKHGRSDGMTWGLYYLLDLKVELDSGLIDAVIRTENPLALMCLQAYGVGTEKVGSLLYQIREKDDLWAIDRYWMLFYQFYSEGLISNPYPQDNVFETLRYFDVSFMRKPKRIK